jgi:hypothetical protein
MQRGYSYPTYDAIPIACRALFSIEEVVRMRACPDPRRIVYPTHRRLTREEDRKANPKNWKPKDCLICGRKVRRTYESLAEWDRRIVCSRKCGAVYRITTQKKREEQAKRVAGARMVAQRLRSGNVATAYKNPKKPEKVVERPAVAE